MLNVYLLPVGSEDSECSATCGNPERYSLISSGILEWFRKFFPRRAYSPDAKLPNR
ncbi:hypothetical protein QFZ91_000713 [Paraburkholderia sp. JPY419]